MTSGVSHLDARVHLTEAVDDCGVLLRSVRGVEPNTTEIARRQAAGERVEHRFGALVVGEQLASGERQRRREGKDSEPRAHGLTLVGAGER